LPSRRCGRDGYGVNELTGHDIDNARQFSIRGHLEFLPTDRLNILLTGEYHGENDRSLAIKFREVSFPGVLTDGNPANDGLSALGQRTNADGSLAAFSTNPRNLRTNFDPINDRDQWALTARVALEASDQVTLRSITSYRDFRAIFFHDFDMSSYSRLSARADRADPQQRQSLAAGLRAPVQPGIAGQCGDCGISTRSSDSSISTRRSGWRITSVTMCSPTPTHSASSSTAGSAFAPGPDTAM
jgi:hypothetical protein